MGIEENRLLGVMLTKLDGLLLFSSIFQQTFSKDNRNNNSKSATKSSKATTSKKSAPQSKSPGSAGTPKAPSKGTPTGSTGAVTKAPTPPAKGGVKKPGSQGSDTSAAKKEEDRPKEDDKPEDEKRSREEEVRSKHDEPTDKRSADRQADSKRTERQVEEKPDDKPAKPSFCTHTPKKKSIVLSECAPQAHAYDLVVQKIFKGNDLKKSAEFDCTCASNCEKMLIPKEAEPEKKDEPDEFFKRLTSGGRCP